MAVIFKLQPDLADLQINQFNQRLAEEFKRHPASHDEGHPDDGPAYNDDVYRFCTRKSNQSWLDSINRDPESPQAHLKPKDRELTMGELQRFFGVMTEVGALDVEVSHSRLAPAHAAAIVAVLGDEPRLQQVRGDSDFEEFCQLAKEGGAPESTLQTLRGKLDIPPPPKKNPKRRERLQSGIAMFQDFNGSDICVMFGHVEEPTYLKDDEYLDDSYNSLYRDKHGRPYLMLPLLALGPKSAEQMGMISQRAWELGLRFEILTFLAAVYAVTPGTIKATRQMTQDSVSERDILQAVDRLRGREARRAPNPIGLSATAEKFNRNKLPADAGLHLVKRADDGGGKEFLLAAAQMLVRQHNYTPADAADMIGNAAARTKRLDGLMLPVAKGASEEHVAYKSEVPGM